MTKRNFVHLHVHTKYSIGDGIADIMDLISAAKNAGMDAVAITDDCVMNGVAEFYCEAISRGIKPIIGCEVYVAEEPLKGDNTNAKNESHLVLLAENQTGYHNLIKLLSQFNNESMEFDFRKSYEPLRELHDGIICLSGSEDGMLYRYLKDGDEEQAETLVKRHINLFGKNNYFLELQQHGREEDRIVNEGLKRMAKKNGLSLVATNAVRYLQREDQDLYAVWRRICEKHNCNKRINDHDDNRDYYFKTVEEMDELFIDCPEALENTRLIAERCNVNLKISRQSYDSHPILVSFRHRSLQYWQPILGSRVGSDESKVEEAIIDYAKERYDYTYAARIASTGHFTIGAAIREVGSILDISSDEVECILGLVNTAIEYDEGFYANFKLTFKKSSKLRKAYRENQHVKRLVDLAYGVQHLIFRYGVHASAFVLAPKPLEEYFPLQICDGCFATEYTCKSLEGLGIEKMLLEE